MSHFNIGGGMTGRPLFHRICCSWFPTLLAPIRSTRWLKFICNPICLTALHRPFSSALGSALLYLSWLLLLHSFMLWHIQVFGLSPFNMFCTMSGCRWRPTGLPLSMASVRQSLEIYFDKNYNHLKVIIVQQLLRLAPFVSSSTSRQICFLWKFRQQRSHPWKKVWNVANFSNKCYLLLLICLSLLSGAG